MPLHVIARQFKQHRGDAHHCGNQDLGQNGQLMMYSLAHIPAWVSSCVGQRQGLAQKAHEQCCMYPAHACGESNPWLQVCDVTKWLQCRSDFHEPDASCFLHVDLAKVSAQKFGILF